MRMLSALRWRLLEWHAICDHAGDTIDFSFASSGDARRYAAFTYNEVLLRGSLKIGWQAPDVLVGPKPLRAIFKTFTVRQKKLTVRWL